MGSGCWASDDSRKKLDDGCVRNDAIATVVGDEEGIETKARRDVAPCLMWRLQYGPGC